VNKLNKHLSASASGKKMYGVFMQFFQKFIGGGKLGPFPSSHMLYACLACFWHISVAILCKKEANDFFFVVYWL
jgi:hypothetical protein